MLKHLIVVGKLQVACCDGRRYLPIYGLAVLTSWPSARAPVVVSVQAWRPPRRCRPLTRGAFVKMVSFFSYLLEYRKHTRMGSLLPDSVCHSVWTLARIATVKG